MILLDYAMNSLRLIQEQTIQSGAHIGLVRGDAFYLPFKTNSLDITFHQGLLEHFKKPEGILKENARALKPGGFAIADVPQRYHVYTVVKHILILLNKWFAGWEREFSIRELELLFTDSGLEVIKSYGDWMRPSFAYRCLRELTKKVHIALPLYPKSISIFSKLRSKMRGTLKKYRGSYYTFMDIGVIGKKTIYPNEQ
jgi:ubiquinone/menaquinone biosynthesis C-methylase UbiE